MKMLGTREDLEIKSPRPFKDPALGLYTRLKQKKNKNPSAPGKYKTPGHQQASCKVKINGRSLTVSLAGRVGCKAKITV